MFNRSNGKSKSKNGAKSSLIDVSDDSEWEQVRSSTYANSAVNNTDIADDSKFSRLASKYLKSDYNWDN